MKKSRLLGITKSLSRVFASILLLGWVGFANANVIDFEGASGSAFNIGEFIDVGDYRFTLTGGNNLGFEIVSGQSNIIEPGTTKLYAANESEITMTRIDGSAFDLISLDIGGSYIDPALWNRWADSVNIIGGTDITNVVLDGAPAAYQNIALNYLNVSSVLFDPIINDNFGPNNYEFVIDNLADAVVPVPAAVWLFGSGLLGLVGMAKRKKTAL